jgi:hypothetical protein
MKLPPQIKPLSPAERLMVNKYLETSNGALSARLAGLTIDTLSKPHVKQAISDGRALLQKSNVYDADQAMKEAKRAMAFAHRTNNANAYVKAVELRAKIMGLLQDKALGAMLGMFQIVISGVREGRALAAPPIDTLSLPPPSSSPSSEDSKTDLDYYLEELNDPGSLNPKPLPGASPPPPAFEEDVAQTNLTIEDLL